MSTQPYRESPLSPQSGSNFFPSVGTVFYDVDITGMSSDMPYGDLVTKLRNWHAEGKALGATTGDYNFIIDHNIEDIETNDRISRVIGLMRMGAIDASLTCTIQEITFENMQKIIPTAFVDETGALRSHNQILPEHFKTVVHAVTQNDGTLRLNVLLNALQINEVNTTFTTGTTGATIPLNFVGTAAQLEDMQYGAYKIWNFPMPGATPPPTPGMTDAEKLEADRVAVVNASFEIPITEQSDQTTRTAWVQDTVNGIINYATAAVVHDALDDYEVTLSLGAETPVTVTITTTDEV